MLATAGFSDILDMGFERRYDLFDLRVKYPPPLVPRRLRLEVAERVRFDGSVETPLDEAAVRAAAKRFQELGVAAVAVCFLHAYANPAHEVRAAADPARGRAGPVRVRLGRRVPEHARVRALDDDDRQRLHAADVRPLPRAAGERAWPSQGFRGRLYIMASSGGTLTADTARRFPVRALESGPAAGALMSAYHGRSLDLPQPAVLRHGRHHGQGRARARRHADQALQPWKWRACTSSGRAAGSPIRIPAIDMIEIGAGGGSIAEIDDRGLLRVGPRSAGADPGPACYGRGGTQADADGRQPGARLSRRRLLPRRRHGARPARPPRPPSATAWPSRSGSRRCARPGASTTSSARTWRAPSASTPASAASTTARAAWWRSAAPGRCTRSRIARKLRIPRVVFPVGCRRHVGARAADQPARLRDGALAAHPCRRHRRRRFRRHVRGAGERGDVVPAERRRRRGRHPPQAARSTCATRARATRSR